MTVSQRRSADSGWPGHVTPGDPAWGYVPHSANQPAPWTVRKISVSEMNNNVYLVTSQATQAQILIDAAAEPDNVIGLIESQSSRLDAVATTHSHWDHHRALTDVVQRYACTSAAGVADAAGMPVHPDLKLQHGDSLRAGDLKLKAIALRGHTPGSTAFCLSAAGSPTVLFTGDSLFPGGPGATQNPQDFASLMSDLRSRIFDVFDDDTIVMPGHGDNTTVGQERPFLDEWEARGW
ncbi:MBL fold metallo-hydrolase [Ornithinimicrobium sp. Arc0846-15]|nr:MBL fold metallo-hydrolase [Ornithinimicrobium laminariae]